MAGNAEVLSSMIINFIKFLAVAIFLFLLGGCSKDSSGSGANHPNPAMTYVTIDTVNTYSFHYPSDTLTVLANLASNNFRIQSVDSLIDSFIILSFLSGVIRGGSDSAYFYHCWKPSGLELWATIGLADTTSFNHDSCKCTRLAKGSDWSPQPRVNYDSLYIFKPNNKEVICSTGFL